MDCRRTTDPTGLRAANVNCTRYAVNNVKKKEYRGFPTGITAAHFAHSGNAN